MNHIDLNAQGGSGQAVLPLLPIDPDGELLSKAQKQADQDPA